VNEVTVATLPQLHIPDEPVARAAAWYQAVLDGTPFDEVLAAPDGPTAWLWARWRVLAGAGVTPEEFAAVVAGYRRELWLWLAGARTWAPCCAGLVGRLARRVDA
jgi:hypothetical protein